VVGEREMESKMWESPARCGRLGRSAEQKLMKWCLIKRQFCVNGKGMKQRAVGCGERRNHR